MEMTFLDKVEFLLCVQSGLQFFTLLFVIYLSVRKP